MTESSPALLTRRRTFGLSHALGDVSRWEVVAPDGAVVVSSDHLPGPLLNSRRTYTWTGARPPEGSRIDLVVGTRVRHL